VYARMLMSSAVLAEHHSPPRTRLSVGCNWLKPVHYVPTAKINASFRIRIQQILKVKIHIILTSFITSLVLKNKFLVTEGPVVISAFEW